jgi:large subunit ribosomal protein L29
MNITEMRGKTPAELQTELSALAREQFNLRMQQATGQLGNPARVRTLRREIARIRTVLNQKGRGAA